MSAEHPRPRPNELIPVQQHKCSNHNGLENSDASNLCQFPDLWQRPPTTFLHPYGKETKV